MAGRVLRWAAAGGGAGAGNGLGAVTGLADRLASDVTAVAVSVALLFIALNGLKWIASGGSTSRQYEAKSGLGAAAAGLMIALTANVLVHLIVRAVR
jgi:hypothetical protein